MIKKKRWKIKPTCAIKGDGLFKGLKWLRKKLIKRQQKLRIKSSLLCGSAVQEDESDQDDDAKP